MSAQDLTAAGAYGVEYILRAGAPVAVYRVSAREDGCGWLCRDADGSGPLRTYAGRDIHGTAGAALSGRSAYESTSRAIRGRVSGRTARQVSLTAEQWAKIDRHAASHGGRPEALGAMIDAYPEPAATTPDLPCMWCRTIHRVTTRCDRSAAEK